MFKLISSVATSSHNNKKTDIQVPGVGDSNERRDAGRVSQFIRIPHEVQIGFGSRGIKLFHIVNTGIKIFHIGILNRFSGITNVPGCFDGIYGNFTLYLYKRYTSETTFKKWLFFDNIFFFF